MSELSIALSNPGTGAAITAFARTALAVTATAVLAPEVGTIVAVAGAYVAVGAAYYAWKQAQNDQLQALAMKGLCSGPNPIPSCGTGYQLRIYSTNNRYVTGFDVYPSNTPDWAYSAYRIIDQIDTYPSANTIENGRYYIEAYLHRPGSPFWQVLFNVDPRTLVETPIGRKPWSEWTQAERESAIRNLTDADWNNVLKQIASEGTLQPGQTLPNDVITLDNAQVQSAGTKALTAEQQAVREAIRPELDKINSDLAKNAAAIAAISTAVGLTAGTIGSLDNKVANLGNVANQTKNAVEATKSEMNDNFNKIQKRLSGIASFLNFDRILNILIWWQTLHNAFMLSADVSRSLVSAFSTVLKALPGDSLLGLPTESEDGSPLDLATTINSSVESWVKGAIGTENYVQMKATLAEINRIYQSTANGVFLIQGSIQAMHSITEVIGERVGRVGNALMRFGVVGDHAYNRMSENMNTRTAWIDRLQERVGNAQAAISSVEQIAQSVVSIQDNITQLKTQKQQIDTSLQKLDIVEAPDNEATKARTDAETKASATPNIDRVDTIRPSELAV